MSPTSEDSSGRHWQLSLKVDSRGYPRLEFMGIRPESGVFASFQVAQVTCATRTVKFSAVSKRHLRFPNRWQFQHHHSGPLAEEQNDRWKHRTFCSEIDFAGSVSLDGGFGFMGFGRELVVHFRVVCADIF